MCLMYGNKLNVNFISHDSVYVNNHTEMYTFYFINVNKDLKNKILNVNEIVFHLLSGYSINNKHNDTTVNQARWISFSS